MHKCPECGCTKYIESGKMSGYYEMLASDNQDDQDEISKSGWNDGLYDSMIEHPYKIVKCYECGKKYK